MQKISEGSFSIVQKVGGEHMRLCRLRSGQRVLIERLNFDPKGAIGRNYGKFEVSNGGKVVTPIDNTPKSLQLQVEEQQQPQSTAVEPSIDVNGVGTSADDNHEKECPQQLTGDQIMALKDGGIAATELVSRLVSGNSFFQSRTKFSKEKYVRKKAHKHSDRIIISKPNIRLLAECYFRKDAERMSHLRTDHLGLILQLSGIHSGNCNVFVFEQVLGLLGAAVLERICGNGSCIFLHRGDWPQSIPCLEAMEFDERHWNTFWPLRVTTLLEQEMGMNFTEVEVKREEEIVEKCPEMEETEASEEERQLTDKKQQKPNDQQGRKRTERAEKEGKAMELIRSPEGQEEGRLDSICLASRTVDPVDILQRVYPALRLSGTIVIYSPIRMHLVRAWEWLRSVGSAVDIQLSHQFCRLQQVLPNRTHPLMLQSVSGGYVLYATKVQVPQSQQTLQREHNREREQNNKQARIDQE